MMYCFQAHRQPWRQAEKITHKKTDRGRNKKRQETQARQAPTLSNGHVRLCPSLLILCKQMKLSPFCEGLIAWLEHGLNQKYRNAGRYQKKASEPRCNEKKCLYFTWQCVFKIAANYRPSSGHCQQQLRHLYCVTLMSWGGGWLSIKVQARRDTSSTEGEKEGGGEERGTEGGEGGERTNLLKPDKFGRDHCAYPTTAPHERYGSWAMTFTQQTQEMRFLFFFLQYQQPWSNWKEKRKEGGGKRMGLSKRGGRRKRSRQRMWNSGSGRNITSYVVFQTLFLGLWWKMSRGRGRVREGIHEDHQRELDCENTSVTSNVKYTDGERARGKESTKASFPFSLSEFDRLLLWLPLRYFWVISLSLQPSRLFDGSSSDHRLSLPFCCFLSPSPVYWECITSPVFLIERLGNPPPAHTYLCNTIRRRCASYSWQWPWWRPLSICSNTYKHNIYCHVK